MATNSQESNEKEVVDVILAERTKDSVKTVGLANSILATEYDNDTNQWKKAMYHAIKNRNHEYLLQEHNSRSPTHDLIYKVNENVRKAAEMLEEQRKHNKKIDGAVSSDLLLTGVSLVRLFNDFSLIMKNENVYNLDFSEVTEFVRSIHLNLTDYLHCKEKIDVANGITTDAEPLSKKTSDVSTKTNVISTSVPISTKVHSGPKNPSTSSKETQQECVSNTQLKQPVRFSNGSNLHCTVCESKICSYNNDEKLSFELHNQTDEHLRNVEDKKVNKKTERSNNKSNSETEKKGDIGTKKNEARELVNVTKQLQSELGADFNYIEVDTVDTFKCKVCTCVVFGTKNVVAHLKGGKHLRQISSSDVSNKNLSGGSSNNKEDVSVKSKTDAEKITPIVELGAIPVEKLKI